MLIDYDYAPYPLFGSADDEHPRFATKVISEKEAVSSLQDTTQIDAKIDAIVTGITLVEEFADIEWDGKKDSVKNLIGIIFNFSQQQIAIQGDCMIPLLDIIKGEDIENCLIKPRDEFSNDPQTKFKVERNFVTL